MGPGLRLFCVLIPVRLKPREVGAMDMKGLFLSFVIGLGVGVIYALVRVKSPAPPIIALLGLLGMVIGEQLGTWIQTRKLDVARAASACLVGEPYDQPRSSEETKCA